MRSIALLLLMMVTIALSACAPGRSFDRVGLRRSLQMDQTEVSDEAIAQALQKQPQLSLPFKLAIYFRQAETPPYRPLGRAGSSARLATRGPLDPQANQLWQWSSQDRNALMDYLELQLDRKGIVSEIIPVLTTLTAGEDLRSIRMAAARQGADAVLVISGICDMQAYHNSAAYTYGVLFPMLFVPGTEVDTLFLANGLMWDVSNEYLYLAAESEALIQKTIPESRVNKRSFVNEARVEALDALIAELGERLVQMGEE